jgi:hypothetical protein
MPLSSFDGSLLDGLEAINKVNGTRHFCKPENDRDDWYTYTTRNRQWRLDATVDASLDGAGDHLSTDGWKLSADTVTNQQKATVSPVSFTPSSTVVWQAEGLPYHVTSAADKVIWVEFDDFVDSPAATDELHRHRADVTLEPFGNDGEAHHPHQRHDDDHGPAHRGRAREARQLGLGDRGRHDLAGRDARHPRRVGDQRRPRGRPGERAGHRGAHRVAVRRPAVPPDGDGHQLDPRPVRDRPVRHRVGHGRRAPDDLAPVRGGRPDARLDYARPRPKHLHTTTYVLQECAVQSDPGWFVLDTSELDSADILAY